MAARPDPDAGPSDATEAGGTGAGGFHVVAPYGPAGDQPAAIESLLEGLAAGERRLTLAGITGSGKSFTLANVVARWGRPALVLAPNKALAAQLFAELREFLPHNRVEYFVSYYDYYQPEAYVPASDTYIEKTATINEEIDRLRHAATEAALTRRDTVVVASVSAIYGLGSPASYRSQMLELAVGEQVGRQALLTKLVSLQYSRNDVEVSRGRFRARGDTVELAPAHGGPLLRVELFDDEVEGLAWLDPTTREVLSRVDEVLVPPASHYSTDRDTVLAACTAVEDELDARLEVLRDAGNLVAAQRLEQRVRRDLDLLRETGWCAGVENYSRHLEGRAAGDRPWTLIDYFPDDLLLVLDESHVAVPQLRAARAGDRQRKETLVDHGFRLPSALDNRPLDLEEVEALLDGHGSAVVFSSATPGPHELEVSDRMVDQVVRPTGLLDPDVVVRPRTGGLADALVEVRATVARGNRVLMVTLTKKSAEDLVVWLGEQQVRARHMHSDTDTLERIELLRDLRLGHYDVLVGINLLREGLDLPEVELVCVLDADTEGFLRSERSLLQIIGRAARNDAGRVVLYADRVTPAMAAAMTVTASRRALQEAHNAANGVVPRTVRKQVGDLLGALELRGGRAASPVEVPDDVDVDELVEHGVRLEAEMLAAADALEFERAAALRDELAAVEARLALLDAVAADAGQGPPGVVPRTS